MDTTIQRKSFCYAFFNHSSSLTQDFVAPIKQSVSMNLVMKGSRSVKKGFIKHKKRKDDFYSHLFTCK